MASYFNGKSTKNEDAPLGGGAGFTHLLEGTKVKGKIETKSDIRIDGFVDGEIICDGKLILGNKGSLQVNLETTEVTIDGTYKGDVKASRQLTVGERGIVDGNINTPSLIIKQGAKVNGQVSMPKTNKEVFKSD